MPLCEIGGVGGDLVSNDALSYVLLIWQTQMLLRRHIAEHRRAKPANHCGADRRSDVIVAGRDVCGQRPERIEWRFVTDRKLFVHILLDQMHRNVAWAFDHYLAI